MLLRNIALCLLFVAPAHASEQVLHLAGDPDRKVDLVVTLVEPPGRGPFPLAVVNHPSGAATDQPAKMKPLRGNLLADYFLSRGYAVAMPMARGYAGSGGAQTPHKCEASEIALENGRDIAGVIVSLAATPSLDVSRVVVAGIGFGGWNTLGLGAVMPPDGVKGLVNFFGGISSADCNERIGGEAAGLEEGARRMGANTTLPSVWFYGANDSLFDDNVWKTMHAVYQTAGGHAELVDVGGGMKDSRQMLQDPKSAGKWAPQLDAFLERIALPSAERFPNYLPGDHSDPTSPAPTGAFAPLDDVAAVPWVNDQGRDGYRRYLTMPSPKAFAIATGGQAVVTQGGEDPLARAKALCAKQGLECRPYAVDNKVVWVTPPEPAVTPDTGFAKLNDASAIPFIGTRARATYTHFLTLPFPRAFVISKAGQSVASQGGYDPLTRALKLCLRNGFTCRPYAVDDHVVWRGDDAGDGKK